MSNLIKRKVKKMTDTMSCKSAKVKSESMPLSPVKVLKLDLTSHLNIKAAE
jgi:hypothetical protein